MVLLPSPLPFGPPFSREGPEIINLYYIRSIYLNFLSCLFLVLIFFLQYQNKIY